VYPPARLRHPFEFIYCDYIKNALKKTVLSAAFAEFADRSHCVLLLYINADYPGFPPFFENVPEKQKRLRFSKRFLEISLQII